jgi:putative intracellular protease/amidase
MRKILIVGAGQSGLQLALGLQQHSYEVTVLSARTPSEIRGGRVMSTQCLFSTALQNERELNLNLWDDEAPEVKGIGVSLPGPDGNRAVDWLGILDAPAQSVDQRVKMPAWLELVEKQGGKVVYEQPTPASLDAIADGFDLVVVAAGRGPLADLFERVPARSPHSAPPRALAVSYVHGAQRRPEHPETDGVFFNVVPGVGEIFSVPGYTFSGKCEMPIFEGVPGGPLDCWSDRPGPAEHWQRMLDLMRQFAPWEYERFKNAELTDEQATLAGSFTPGVRNPVAQLPSGTPVLGMGDVVVSNDPITGQGANNASKFAKAYLDSILQRGDQPFDQEWMQQTFERHWERAQHVTKWTHAMLQPPPEHVLNLFGAAGVNQSIADLVANSFAAPSADSLNWFFEPAAANEVLSQAAQN